MSIYLIPKLPGKCKVYIYGVNNTADSLAQQLKSKYGEQKLIGFLQTVQDSEEYNNLPVKRFSPSLIDEETIIIIAVVASKMEVHQYLKDSGIKETQIYFPEKFPLIRRLEESQKYNRIILYPPIKFKEDYNKICKKMVWYYPKSKDTVEIVLYGEKEFYDGFLSEVKMNSNMKGEKIENIYINDSTLILLWDINYLKDEILRNYINNVACIDEKSIPCDEPYILGSLYSNFLPVDICKSIEGKSISLFKELMRESSKFDSALVIGNGPSAIKYSSFNVSNTFNIICNTMAKDEVLMSKIKPNLICFGDIVYHLSYHKYSLNMRKDVIKLVERYKTKIVTRSHSVPLLLKHYPELKGFLIGIKSDGFNKFNFPSVEKLNTTESSSVSTIFMLPIASSLFKKIFILGLDGKNPEVVLEGSERVWEHSINGDYLELKKEVERTHPGCFVSFDKVVNRFLTNDTNSLEEFLRYGESKGRTYISICKSFQMAIKKRYKEGYMDE